MAKLDRWADWLAHRVRFWWALLGIIVFTVFIAVVLPAQAAESASYTKGFSAPDSSFWYRSADLYAAADAWGEVGRAAYVRARYTFDVVWPLAYGVFLTTCLAWLFARGTAVGSWPRRLALLPALVVLLDYAENVCTATVIGRFPARTPVLAQLAPIFTASKWVLLSSCFVLLFVGVVLAVIRRLRAH